MFCHLDENGLCLDPDMSECQWGAYQNFRVPGNGPAQPLLHLKILYKSPRVFFGASRSTCMLESPHLERLSVDPVVWAVCAGGNCALSSGIACTNCLLPCVVCSAEKPWCAPHFD